MSKILDKIEKVEFPDRKFSNDVYDKKQIVIHHTVSNPDSAMSPIRYWISKEGRIATAFVMDSKGLIKECFNSKLWSNHIGVKSADFRKYKIVPINLKLNQDSIGIEICNWGYLIKKDDGYYNVYGQKISDELEVVEYPDGFRGYKYYQKYTKDQIESLRELIIYLAEEHNIPLDYQIDMWDVSLNALEGKPGIWSHVSYRSDKFDCHPQEELKEMLRGLKPLF